MNVIEISATAQRVEWVILAAAAAAALRAGVDAEGVASRLESALAGFGHVAYAAQALAADAEDCVG